MVGYFCSTDVTTGYGYYIPPCHYRTHLLRIQEIWPWISNCGYWLADNRVWLDMTIKRCIKKIKKSIGYIIPMLFHRTVRSTSPIHRYHIRGRK